MVWEKQEGRSFWNPEKENEELIGKVVEIIDEPQFGMKYLIENEAKDTIVTPSHRVLQSRMVKAQVGDKVKIVFLRNEPPKVRGQNPTKIYDVYIDRQPQGKL